MSAVDRLLAAARDRIAPRLPADALAAALAGGALVVDIRPVGLRHRDGDLPGGVVVDRNVLEWRLDPTSTHRLPGFDDPGRPVVVVCDEGYASSLAADTLRALGVHAATDLVGGFQAWSRSGSDYAGPTRVRGMSDTEDFNAKVIDDFRANGGKLSGEMASMPVLLLHNRGRRSGKERVNPVAYQQLDSGWAVFGSFAGAPRHPDWYLNLLASPKTTIEIGDRTVEVSARTIEGSERDTIFERQRAAAPIFTEYQEKAGDRVIPVVVLEPVTR